VGHYKVTIQEAAERLGVKEPAIRKRIERGTLEKEKGEDGRVYVFVDEPPAEERNASQDSGFDSSYVAGYDMLVMSQQERIEDLREQLAAERRANEENRRIIAALTQRIPELEAPSSPVQPEPAEPAEPAEPSLEPEREEPERVEPERAEPEREKPERVEPERVEPETPAEMPMGPTLSEASEAANEEGTERESWWRRVFGA
jgi:hypothetical protein